MAGPMFDKGLNVVRDDADGVRDDATDQAIEINEQEHELISAYHRFMQELELNKGQISPEQQVQMMRNLESYAKVPDRVVRVYTDPSLDTFMCAKIPSEKVDSQGNIVSDNINRSHFLIGVPYIYVEGGAPIDFMLGEIQHEQGHSFWTDFNALEKNISSLGAEGNDLEGATGLFKTLLNVIEDPRMERVVGGPNNPGQRKLLWAKNSKMIIPNISEGLVNSEPVKQLMFLIKLERLWAIHEEDRGEMEKPWDIDLLHPRVKEIYQSEVESALSSITGDAKHPPLKISDEMYKRIMEEIWPAVVELAKEFPPSAGETGEGGDSGEGGGEGGEGSEGGEGEGEGGDSGEGGGEGGEGGDSGEGGGEGGEGGDSGEGGGEGGEGSEGGEGEGEGGDSGEGGGEGGDSGEGGGEGGEGSEGGERCEGGEGGGRMLDPQDPENWPEPEKSMLQKLLQQHKKRLENDADKAKAANQNKLKNQNKIDQERNNLRSKKDGFINPDDRENYLTIAREIRPVSNKIARIFERYLPPVEDPEETYNMRGTEFDVGRFVQSIGTGDMEPMIQFETAESRGLVLQIMVDVSGSMYQDNGERIKNAMKTCVAICEGAQDYNVFIEILASDHSNVSESEKYLIKSFDQSYDAQVKNNILKMVTDFGGDNQDADSIRAALPRMQRELQEVWSELDRIAALMVFISDSTTRSAETRDEVGRTRLKIPLEGVAIDRDPAIADMVKYHFGENSVVPPDLESFPVAFAGMLRRHVAGLGQ